MSANKNMLVQENLENPETYVCDVHSYEISHSLLYVYAKKGGKFFNKENLYVLFSNTLYFEGPYHWDGLHFTIGAQEECVKILKQINYPYQDHPPEHFPQLFKLETNNLTIKIIANRLLISRDNTPASVLARSS